MMTLSTISTSPDSHPWLSTPGDNFQGIHVSNDSRSSHGERRYGPCQELPKKTRKRRRSSTVVAGPNITATAVIIALLSPAFVSGLGYDTTATMIPQPSLYIESRTQGYRRFSSSSATQLRHHGQIRRRNVLDRQRSVCLPGCSSLNRSYTTGDTTAEPTASSLHSILNVWGHRRCLPRLSATFSPSSTPLFLASTDQSDAQSLDEAPDEKNRQSSSNSNVDRSNEDGVDDMISLTVEKLDRRLAKLESKYVTRITRLEEIVSRQEVELHKLRKTCGDLQQVSEAFAQVLNLLRESGLDDDKISSSSSSSSSKQQRLSDDTTSSSSSDQNASANANNGSTATNQSSKSGTSKVVESFDDAMIFGRAPSSVIQAADDAGTAVLAGLLGGKQRMLVDVRDAELSTDPETLVQFIELSILPVAAGLEGLKSTRNRVKIVFPKVSQLLEYRRTMALAAPDVVALSTLVFDPVEDRDKIVVIVAPEPDDDEGMKALEDLLSPVGSAGMVIEQPLQQPVVLLNYHMHPPPVSSKDGFETAYHLRLLTVQYMSKVAAEQSLEEKTEEGNQSYDNEQIEADSPSDVESSIEDETSTSDIDNQNSDDTTSEIEIPDEDDELENAVKHAHNIGTNSGTTRAMVIRAYPRPWHVFVDLSPDTDADFEVAATFDEEPTVDELNMAIVECLEGSDREDELVAQQMQQALEDGQLDRVSDIIGDVLNPDIDGNDDDDDIDPLEIDSV